jgi:hypothetical protein
MPKRAGHETVTKTTRKKPGTAPTNDWTRRAHERLHGLLGASAARYPLPDLDADAKRTIKAMKAELDARDPSILLLATVNQIARVERYCAWLDRPSPVVAGKLSKADAKAFLDEHKWFSPPTDRQMAYARSIASTLCIDIPKERGIVTFATVDAFIREHRGEAYLRRNDNETEAQLRQYEGGTYAALQRAAFSGTDYGI